MWQGLVGKLVVGEVGVRGGEIDDPLNDLGDRGLQEWEKVAVLGQQLARKHGKECARPVFSAAGPAPHR